MSVSCRQSTTATFAASLTVRSYDPMGTGFFAAPIVMYIRCAVKTQSLTVTFAQRLTWMKPPYGAPWSCSPVISWRTPATTVFDRSTSMPRLW